MKTTTSQKTTPTLRFPGFSDAWDEKKLGLISQFSDEKISAGNFNESNFIGVDNLLPNLQGKTRSQYMPIKGKYSKYISGDILHSNIRPYLRKAWQADSEGGASADVLVIRPNDNLNFKFLYYKITSESYFDYVMSGVKGVKMPRGDKDHIMNYLITIPTKIEQNKIADFLSSVDAWIYNLKKQKQNLESYKKGMMQKIFSQEMRFKDENCQDFTEWKEKRLGEVCEIKKGKQLNRSGLSESVGFPVINGGVSPSGYTNIFNTEAGTITISEGGNSCGYINFLNTKFWSGGHCYSLSDLTPEIHVNFLYIFLKFKEENIMKLRVGSGLPNIQRKDLDKFILKIPEIREQQKIFEFLGSVDNMLELKQKQIAYAEGWKKGVMQGVFI